MLADTGRVEKMIVNRLEALQATYGDLSSADRKSLEAALEFIRTISGTKLMISKNRKELAYLEHMKGYKLKQSVVDDYLEFVDYCYNKRKKIEARASFSNWESLRMELELLDKAPYDSDISPVW